jgi:diguanylate cyclase (GGDEF)-like protein
MDRLISAINRFAELPVTRSESERRRAKLLSWILLFILIFLTATFFVILIFNPHNDSKQIEYRQLILGMLVFVLLAYVLNRFGHYYKSAGLIVFCAIIAPWASLNLDPSILNGDFVPLTYITLSVLISSILLPTSITIVLAILQGVGLIFLLAFSPFTPLFNWFSFLSYVLFISVFSILSNYLSQRDMEQIVRQAHQLTQNEAQLKEQSIRDYLTNLFNRRYLEETLEREIQRAVRKQIPLGVIMLDIDNFKHFNDSMGHALGDILLQELGKLLSEQIRLADIACRYGGDEFVLIMPEASQDVTKERAENMRDKVARLRLEYKNHTLENVSISLGVAIFPDHGSSREAILESADAALYRAKSRGYGCVALAE